MLFHTRTIGILSVLCLMSSSLTLVACGQAKADSPPAASSSGAADYEVTITDDAFIPAELTIEEGDIVTWINQGSKRYTVTSWDLSWDEDYTAHVMIGRTWDSGDIFPGESYTRIFERAGSYDYFSFPLLESPGWPMAPFLEPAIEDGLIRVYYGNAK